MRILRLLKIIITLHRYGLYQILRHYHKTSIVATIIETTLFFIPRKYLDKTLPQRTKLAFESLGPVFVKFGQILSTRQDLIPYEYVIELSKLQNQVKPFASDIAVNIVEKSLKGKLDDIFSSFNIEPAASASIAQVHKAVLKESNQTVAVKILRPRIEQTIANDIKILKLTAWLIEKLYKDGKRLRPQEVVLEFEKIIKSELDFTQEAANATELRRLHRNDSHLIIIPEVYFDYCTHDVLVLEWMDGIPISDLKQIQDNNIDLKKLSHNGVTIFYTQVFYYGFFHADMHPGNILCDNRGRYIGLDFGIVGYLSSQDKRYLAINILAFFNRDYKKVALTHIESGWAPKDTPVEEFENAIRAVCEPIFNKPLAQISFGQVLVRLFQVSRRFGITIQPQLILLQKTIVNVEGLGRVLNPELDLWVTAKPILEKWMRQQMGVRGLINNLKEELPFIAYNLPKLPRILLENLSLSKDMQQQNNNYLTLLKRYKWQNKLLLISSLILVATLILVNLDF
jgi:ubiquinone biosynthesis protein